MRHDSLEFNFSSAAAVAGVYKYTYESTRKTKISNVEKLNGSLMSKSEQEDDDALVLLYIKEEYYATQLNRNRFVMILLCIYSSTTTFPLL